MNSNTNKFDDNTTSPDFSDIDPDYMPNLSASEQESSSSGGSDSDELGIVNKENAEEILNESEINTMESVIPEKENGEEIRNEDEIDITETVNPENIMPLPVSNVDGPGMLNTVSNNFGQYKVNGQLRKGSKKGDFCFYCETNVLNFSRHIVRNHSQEVDVQKISAHPPKSKQRHVLLDAVRKRGNYLYSSIVCKPVRKSDLGRDALPCDKCLGFYSSKLLWKHRRECTKEGSKNHMASAQNLMILSVNVDHQLKTTVFPKMRPDEISLVAKKDPLICAFGARYIKTHREKHFVTVASRKMRELSRLLIEARKRDATIRCLFDALRPKYFDLLVDATKCVAKFDDVKGKFGSPSYALNMGTTLKQCAELAIILALKRKQVCNTVKSADIEADLKTLIQVIESQWQYDVSSQAANDLNINKWNKVTLVPLASDLKLLKDFLLAKATSSIQRINNKNGRDSQAYMTLMETVFCRVILLNRRRPGELQRLLLSTYEQVKGSESQYEEFEEVISASEKILLKTFKRVVIRGKRGRGVPVLFSTDVQEHIKFLLEQRQLYINKNNGFLFANINSSQPICGYKTLKKYATSCGAKNPNAITTTRLRKHLATLTQLFSMSENDMEQLATFMGHTLGVHKGSYRLPDDVYQTAKISKILLLLEKGGAGEFKGKTLNEICINMEEDLLESEDEQPEPEPLDISVPSCSLEAIQDQPSTSKEIFSTASTSKTNKGKRILVPWTQQQRNVVLSFFANHIKKKIPPKRTECNDLKTTYPELLHNKDWLKIKVFVQNKYTTKKK